MTEHSDRNRTTDTRRITRKAVSVSICTLALLILSSCQGVPYTSSDASAVQVTEEELTIGELPSYTGEPYVEVDGGKPDFTQEEMTEESYENYSELDELGRCREARACVGQETMPEGERESISEIKPTGWQSVEYEEVEGGYLYNRCHLIGYQLTAENANERNLITGTRYMNTEGMLPFEDEVADYVEDTGNHVMYQVTPVFEGRNLVASGVWMEAESVEDNGKGVSFNVYVFNVQPGIVIDYAQGNSREADPSEEAANVSSQGEETSFILNENTRKFHKPDCPSTEDILGKNRKQFTGSREELMKEGYEPCKRCNP